MKIKIPDDLKSDVPQTFWGRVLTATPIIMTVVATALAGLAASEMTRAQYNRSLAAQLQSKAGDQWGFFQAKRLRGAMQRSTLDVLLGTTDVTPLNITTLPQFIEPVTGAALESAQLPDIGPAPVLAEEVQAALAAVESTQPDAEVAQFVLAVPDATLLDAVRTAKNRATELDIATKPINQALENLESALAGQPAARSFTRARLRYSAARYDAEARLNQAVAHLYELQVRKSNLVAERHHKRSQRFFFGMLGTQAAVIISTFAIAARKRSLLWSLAAAAGTGAISFAIYVYLFV